MSPKTKVINAEKFYRMKRRLKPALLHKYTKYGLTAIPACVDVDNGFVYVNETVNTGQERLLSVFYRYSVSDVVNTTLKGTFPFYILY